MKINQNKYKKENIKKYSKLCQYSWQEYARNVVKDFKVVKPYDSIIFKYAKQNISYLKGKVESLKESQDDLTKCGALLTYKLTKNK